jgi:hypothetical protein
MKKRNPREHGQVIILLVAGIISLLGFTALAIDGARLYSERRTAQGTADTAAFTAAAYIGQYDLGYIQSNWMSGAEVEPHAEQAALERIRDNGYTDAVYNPFGGNDRLRITINPVSETLATKYQVNVFLISEVEPVFAHLLYDGELLVNVESKAIVMPRSVIGFGQAMYSLSSDACDAISFDGNSETLIVGSGIYANSSCPDRAVDFGGTAGVDIDQCITTPGGIRDHGSGGYTSGCDSTGVTPQSHMTMPVPDCSGQPPGNYIVDTSSSPTKVVIFPGVYNHKIMITNGANEQIFMPGLYCLNEGMSITNGNITAHDVTFYVPGSKDVKITGGVLDMTAPDNGEADDGTNSWDGMLFYMEAGSWEVTANAGSYFEGTVYAPGPPDPTCKLTGSGITDGYNLQLVCNTISLIGGAGLNIVYNADNPYIPPISIDLIE